VGVSGQGRSLKVVLLRTYLALLGASQKLWEAEKGARNQNNPVDPYMTLVGYFNSLRELGGSRRIVEDEVRSLLEAYSDRKRETEAIGWFAVGVASPPGESQDCRRSARVNFASKYQSGSRSEGQAR
jgi:hypothetical protein